MERTVDDERLIHENAPTPMQLHRLASVGADFASRRQKFRPLKRTDERAHYFVDSYETTQTEGAEGDRYHDIDHRMAGRIALKVVNGYEKVWRFSLFDTYIVSGDGPGDQAARSIYRFEWNRHETLRSERTIQAIGASARTAMSVEESLDALSFHGDELPMLELHNDFSQVNADDCDELTRETAYYFRRLDYQERGGRMVY